MRTTGYLCILFGFLMLWSSCWLPDEVSINAGRTFGVDTIGGSSGDDRDSGGSSVPDPMRLDSSSNDHYVIGVGATWYLRPRDTRIVNLAELPPQAPGLSPELVQILTEALKRNDTPPPPENPPGGLIHPTNPIEHEHTPTGNTVEGVIGALEGVSDKGWTRTLWVLGIIAFVVFLLVGLKFKVFHFNKKP